MVTVRCDDAMMEVGLISSCAMGRWVLRARIQGDKLASHTMVTRELVSANALLQ